MIFFEKNNFHFLKSKHIGGNNMKVLLINGSPHEQGCTYTALAEMQSVFSAEGVESEIFWIGKQPIGGCTACLACKQTGRCVVDDSVNALLDRMDDFDAMVVGSPVYYAGPAGQLCAFLDRLFYCGGKRMAGKLAASVVSCRRGGASAAFDRLNKYFTICNMAVIGSQYWNQVHGSTADDVKKDLEGLQTMRTLARNMVYWLKAKAVADAAGVAFPEAEPRVSTNFIR